MTFGHGSCRTGVRRSFFRLPSAADPPRVDLARPVSFRARRYGRSAITNWLAVSSTSTVNAKDHLGGYSSSVSAWRPDGTQIASSLDTATGGLWSGTTVSFGCFDSGTAGAAMRGENPTRLTLGRDD